MMQYNHMCCTKTRVFCGSFCAQTGCHVLQYNIHLNFLYYRIWSSIFTQMQDDCNLRPPPTKTSAKGKCTYPNLKWHTKNKMSAKKKYFYINFTQLIHKACQILTTFHQSVSLSPSSQSMPSSSSHSLLTFPSSSLPFHHISSVPSIVLEIQHFLNPFILISGEMHCHAVMIQSD